MESKLILSARQHQLLAGLCLMLAGCRRGASSIEFTQVPVAGPGGPVRTEPIAGRVTGAVKGQHVVIYARSGKKWWVQPLATKPFTPVQNSTWRTETHMGVEYAALLVDPGYVPEKTTTILPGKGGLVRALTRTAPAAAPAVPKAIRFSGYEWEVLQDPSDSGGVMHVNSPANAWTDANGWLHLRIDRQAGDWACAEVLLTRSLGYGSYSLVVRQMPPLEPGTVLRMFTWDQAESGQNNREIDVEISQWGDPAAKNAQFTIQPYYVPANTFRFNVPAGAATHAFRWEPGRVWFQTTQDTRRVAEHVFTSGIPSPGAERVHLNLYVFGKSRTPQQRGVEVVIEKFAYLP